MAVRIARRYLRRLPSSFERIEIETVALTGLWEGLRSHPEGPLNYLSVRVVGAIRDELRRQSPLTRSHRQAIRQGTECEPQRASEYEAEQLALSSEDETLRALDQRRLQRAIEEAPITDRQRSVVCSILKGKSHRAIASGLGVSEARISQTCSLTAKALRKHLEGP